MRFYFSHSQNHPCTFAAIADVCLCDVAAFRRWAVVKDVEYHRFTLRRERGAEYSAPRKPITIATIILYRTCPLIMRPRTALVCVCVSLKLFCPVRGSA